METTKKVYDFPFDQVRTQVTSALKKHGNRGTVADVVGLSGLPKHQVEAVLPAVVADCRGQMAVTESGEILYKFPQGLSNPERSLGKKLLHWTGKALAALFKAWILVMLVGYFVLFVVILLVALIASIALSFMRRDDDRDGAEIGGFLGGMMVSRILEFFLVLWLYSGDPYERQQKKKKPFYKAVFEFVFGVEDKPEVRAKMERKAFVSLVRRNNGTVSLEELMALTGKSRAEADAFVSRLMLEFEGEPRVSDQGTLSFFFPGLLLTSGAADRPYILADQPLIPFTRNPSKTNNWIIFLNGFNIVFGIYFLAFGLQGVDRVVAAGDNLSFVYLVMVALVTAFGHVTESSANFWITTVLGIVPALYSAFFFGIPLVRRWREGIKNLAVKTANLRRRVVAAALGRPLEIRLDQVESDSELSAPGKPADRLALKESLLRDLAGDRSIEVKSSSPLVYAVPDLEREKSDLEQIRRTTDLSKYAIGKVVFDTEERIE
jgi:hypothetical protein